MALAYTSGVATNAVNFFSLLENFLTARGWILVSGGGTTTIVYRTIGVSGLFTKLYVRFRRSAEKIYFRVQDDAAGTHSTTENYLTMPGAGAVPFSYWMNGDKNCISIITRSGANYYGCYTGATEPFSLALNYEDNRYVSVYFNSYGSEARVLRRYDGTYDYAGSLNSLTNATYQATLNLLDSSRPLFANFVRGGTDQENYGQLYYVAGPTWAIMGFNSEDTITSGYPAITSDWINFKCGSEHFQLQMTEPLPLGVPDGTFQCVTGEAATYADLMTAIRNFIVALGWTDVAWYAAADPPYDRFVSSTGESGTDTIRGHINMNYAGWPGTGASLTLYVVDKNSVGYHQYHQSYSYSLTFYPANFPVPYIFLGDKDCYILCFYVNSVWWTNYTGKTFTPFPDESLIPFEYKMLNAGNVFASGGSANMVYILRDLSGSWGTQAQHYYHSGYSNCSPNLVDNNTFILWPFGIKYSAGGSVVYYEGCLKYVYVCLSTYLSVNDIIQVGANVYKLIRSDVLVRIT